MRCCPDFNLSLFIIPYFPGKGKNRAEKFPHSFPNAGPGSREGAAAAFPGTTELPERQKTSPTCVGELHSTIREVTMDFFFSGVQLHFTSGHYFHSLATNHLYFSMIFHYFKQIMQFRYYVPAAAYSKDKYRLLFRESRVPAFFPVSLPGVSPTQESPSVAISGRLSRIRRGLSCCCGLVLRDCNKGTSSRCALRAPRLAAQCAKPPCAGGWHMGV